LRSVRWARNRTSRPATPRSIPQAHDAYLQGWSHYNLITPAALAQALKFLEEAVQLDPGYAQAHAALASLYWDAYVTTQSITR
jgi:Tfp pilus assembly protein PilF